MPKKGTQAQNIRLSVLHGFIIVSGLVCYNLGAKRLPAAEIGLLSLTEIVFGIFWVWVPFFGIQEATNFNSMLGGLIIILGIIFYAFGANKKVIIRYHNYKR